jgi:hypothetical protein
MKKISLLNVSGILALAVMSLPNIGHAQTDKINFGRPAYMRPYDQSGINQFETTKDDANVKYEGRKISLGAGFTQQFQSIKHENPNALNNTGNTTATALANKLYPLSPGFMTAQANLFLDVQMAEGVKLNVTTYLSARHHNEAWVKGGYIQFDKLPFKGEFWDNLMKYTTIRVGHYEVNYGDAHFRRTDGGQTLYSPFMEGNIMDAFATEIGGDVTLQKDGVFGVLGMTNGMIKGHIDSVAPTSIDANVNRSPSIILKGGFDKKLGDVRLRLTGSLYHNSSSAGSGLTLYGGDRTGSNYQNVMEKWVAAPGATASAQAYTATAFSGRFNPGFSKKVTAIMFNGFMKVKGLELFGTLETAKGRTKLESADRKATQFSGEAVYRFAADEKLFLGLKYNTVKAALTGYTTDVKVNRFAIAGGWFLTKSVLMKMEIVDQKYLDFPTSDYRSSGRFHGFVMEAVVGF